MAPPSTEALEQRLHGRNTETPEQVAERMAAAREEIATYGIAVLHEAPYLTSFSTLDLKSSVFSAVQAAATEHWSYHLMAEGLLTQNYSFSP